MTIICLYDVHVVLYVFHVFFLQYTKISQILGGQSFQIWWENDYQISHPQV